MKKLFGSALIFGGTFVAAAPAFAGLSAAPAPLLAAGIPALVAVGAGYFIARKRRGD